MGIEIRNNKIINCGTAIKVEGLIKGLNISGNQLIDNMKDMDFYVDEDSDIVIESNFSNGCKTDSITVKEYSSRVEEIIKFTDKMDFSSDEKEKIKALLEEMNASKEEPTKIKKILKEIYDLGKSTSSGLLLAYIKTRLGW